MVNAGASIGSTSFAMRTRAVIPTIGNVRVPGAIVTTLSGRSTTTNRITVFIVEQIAGDELKSDDPEMLVAVGFLRMGPWEHTAMSPDKVSRQLYLDDVVNSIGQTFLSTAMRCCKCHDHKFDPLPTRGLLPRLRGAGDDPTSRASREISRGGRQEWIRRESPARGRLAEA